MRKLVALSSLLFLFACESGPASIKIKGPRDSLEMGKASSVFPTFERKGDSIALRASAFDKKDRFKGTVPVDWESSDRSVATVSQEGVVTFLSSGDVTITAKTKGEKPKTASVPLKAVIIKEVKIVEPKVEKGEVIKIHMGEFIQMRADVLNDRGEVIEDAKVKWSASSYAVTFSVDGKMEGRAMGTGQVTAEAANGATARVDIETLDWKKPPRKKRRRRR